MTKDKGYILIGYIVFHGIITFLLGYFVFKSTQPVDYLIIFAAIEILWILVILNDVQERVSINTSLLEDLAEKNE